MQRASLPKSPSRATPPMTLADLRRALDAKERELRHMVARREALAREIEELGETLEAMLAGSAAAPGRAAAAKPGRRGRKAAAADGKGRRSRGPREGSLPVVIRSVLERVVGPMRVGEIAQAVVKAGYASRSSNLNIIVANRLAQMGDVEKVERGLYQLRRGAGNGDAPAAG